MALPATQALPPRRRRYTVDEYLRRERASLTKHEYDDGEILAMAGATGNHVAIATNVSAELRNRLRGTPCRPYSSDLRVRLAGRPKFVYPDVTVICGERVPDPDDDAGETYLNPHLIVEVLSPSTEKYDRREKFSRYREIESFREYVLVAQDAACVETYFRGPDGAWVFDVATGPGGVAKLRSLKIDLPLAEVYADVTFPPADPAAGDGDTEGAAADPTPPPPP